MIKVSKMISNFVKHFECNKTHPKHFKPLFGNYEFCHKFIISYLVLWLNLLVHG